MVWIDELLAMQSRGASSRVTFYKALAAWDGHIPEPTLQQLCAAAGKRESTFYEHFGAKTTQAILPTGRRLVPAAIEEAKGWYFHPWHQGWRATADRLSMTARQRLESLVVVTARWAQHMPVLAAMDHNSPPGTMPDILKECRLDTVNGPRAAAGLERAAGAMIGKAIAFMLKDPTGSPLGALSHIRPAIDQLFVERTLEVKTQQAIFALSDLILRWRAADERLSPLLLETLTEVIEELRGEQPRVAPGDGHSTDDPADQPVADITELDVATSDDEPNEEAL